LGQEARVKGKCQRDGGERQRRAGQGHWQVL
jgi:hypothetical protein